jgi:hypothetical protein
MTPFEIIALALLGFVGLVFAIALGGLFLLAANERHAAQRLAATPCPVCREPLGRKVVDAARVRLAEEHASTAAETIEEPYYWNLQCPRCRSALTFDYRENVWVDIEPPREAQ